MNCWEFPRSVSSPCSASRSALGTFHDFELELDCDEANPEASTVILTIKDVTKRVELPVTLLGVQDVPEQMSERLGGIKKVASFQAESQLDRRDYGVGVGNWAETAVVGADVEIEIIVEANRK